MDRKATYSRISTLHIQRFIESNYNLPKIDYVDFFSSSMDDIYTIHCRNKKFFFKLYKLESSSATRVEEEGQLMKYLASKQLAAKVVSNNKGKYCSRYLAPEGARPSLLSHEFEGKSVHPLPVSLARKMGQSVGSLHRSLDNKTNLGNLRHIDSEYLIKTPVFQLKEKMRMYKIDSSKLESLGTTLLNKLEKIEDKLDWGICHGDLHTENIMRNGNEFKFIDFAEFGQGYRAYDLAIVKWILDNTEADKEKAKKKWASFIKGYLSVRDIDQINIDAIPLFVAIRHLRINQHRIRGAGYYGSRNLQNILPEVHKGIRKRLNAKVE